MRRKSVVRRLLAVILSVTMALAMVPLTGVSGSAQASSDTEWTKTVASLGTSIIKAPDAPADDDTAWAGSYVWYGRYDGEPLRYRVLNPRTTKYTGAGKYTLFLDCDSVLYDALYVENDTYEEEPGIWPESVVKAGVNGGEFLTKANGFSAIERAAIVGSKVSAHTLTTGNSSGNVTAEMKETFVKSVALTGEKIFFLDCEEACDPAYGYRVSYEAQSRAKRCLGEFYYGYWWLRSTVSEESNECFYQYAGCVNTQPAGSLDFCYKGSELGVSPAFNVDVSSIIFSSVVKGTAGKNNAEYKLTLADSNLTVGVTSGKTVSVSGSKVTVPYTISGSNASKATQVSVLILDKEYKAGNTNNATIKYYGKLNTGSALSTTGTGTFTLPSGLSAGGWGSSYYVYLLAEDVNGIHETDYASAPVKLTKSGGTSTSLTITAQPESKTAYVGNKAVFTVEATGSGTLTYQWQYRKNSSDTWKKSGQSGNATKKLTVATTAGLHGYQFRCLVTDSNGQKYSSAATLSLKPKITAQPENTTAAVGNKAVFTVEATGKSKLTYQWQYRKNETDDWKTSGQSGNKTATLSVSTTAGLHGYQFRCIVTDGNSQKSFTKAATLSVRPKITTWPKDASVSAGSTATFTMAATGKTPLTYQWQYRRNENSEWKASGQSGNKTATLKVAATAGLNGYQFRCYVKDANGQRSYTNTVTLSIIPEITKQPKDKSVYLGSKATFTVEATGTGKLTYQWQYMSPHMTTWRDSGQKGNKTATLSVATKDGLQGYRFRCVVTDKNGQKAYTKAATLTLINATLFPEI